MPKLKFLHSAIDKSQKMLHSLKSIEEILCEIEEQVKTELNFDLKRSRIQELHQSVPEKLKQRLAKLKVLAPETFADDYTFEVDTVNMKVVEPDMEAEIEKRMPTLDAVLEERDISVDSVLELMSRAYKDVHLKCDAEEDWDLHPRHRQKKVNWIAEYIGKLRRHRVQWPSKIYKNDNSSKNWHKKSMIENGVIITDCGGFS